MFSLCTKDHGIYSFRILICLQKCLQSYTLSTLLEMVMSMLNFVMVVLTKSDKLIIMSDITIEFGIKY